MNDSLLKHYYFKPHTYWIYKDSLSGKVDSFSVDSEDTTVFTIWNKSAGTDYIQINLSVYQHDDSGRLTLWRWTLMDDKAYLNIIPSFYQYDYFFIYPLTIMGPVRNPNDHGGDNIAITNKYNSINISARDYYNVFIVSHGCAAYGYYGSYNDLFYINDDYGIVKMKINNSPDSILTDSTHFNNYKIWELQRCSIVR